MVVELIRYTIPGERAEAFEVAYAQAQAQLRLSPDCLGFELSRCIEEPTAYALRIEWSSTEAHLKGFRGGPLFPAFLAHIRPFIDCIDEMRHYERLSVRDDASIFTSAGGEAPFAELAEQMHARIGEDALLGSWFAHASPSHVPHLTQWLIEVFGGPHVYTEAQSDIAPMLARHAHLDIPEDKRARFAQIGADAAAAVWPDRPDVVRAVSR